MGGGLSQLLEEVFLGDVVPEANLGDNVVQRSFGYHFVHRDSDVMFPQRCDFPQSDVASSLSEAGVVQRFEKLDNLSTANLRKLWHRLVLPQIVSG